MALAVMVTFVSVVAIPGILMSQVHVQPCPLASLVLGTSPTLTTYQRIRNIWVMQKRAPGHTWVISRQLITS